MCEYCAKHGGGKKWYLNMRNYSKELEKDKERQDIIKWYFQNIEKKYAVRVKEISPLLKKPIIGKIVRKRANELFQSKIVHQVIPLEEAEAILQSVGPIAKLPCVCRHLHRVNVEKCCLGFGLFAETAKQFRSYSSSIKYITSNEAIDLVKEYDRKGYVHTVDSFKIPYIGAMCECDCVTCAPMAAMVRYGLKSQHPGEYIAEINPSKCIGCMKCISRCQYGAIKSSPSTSMPLINPQQCYGCGLCRTVCENDAINLKPRGKISATFTPISDKKEHEKNFSINIDYNECKNPLECGKCLKTCPYAVFTVYPVDNRPEVVNKEWKVVATYEESCIDCGKCVDICPKNAIKFVKK
jgi:NAD-dependent dihydropyrimidine dehydrogenase PreA subunit